jgi:hypothetical protein
MSYEKYIVWRRLTNNGRRGREDMSPESQAEYDAQGFTEVVLEGSYEEAKLEYEALTRRSDPGSAASS